jgi:putative holliday junction resolvase
MREPCDNSLTSAPPANPSQAAAVLHQSYLCFDYGQKRIGVASGNTLTRCATPVKTLSTAGNMHFEAIQALIKEWQPNAIVVGVPYHPDGNAHINTERACHFAKQLQERFKLPVHQVDERYTTTEAAARASAAGRTTHPAGLDAAAAAVILEQFLNTALTTTAPRHG